MLRARVFLTPGSAKQMTPLKAIGQGRSWALGELAPPLPAELLSEALTAARSIEDSTDGAHVLVKLAPQVLGNLLQQGFEELLGVLHRCTWDLFLFAVFSCFLFLEEFQGTTGREDVCRAMVDTVCWFP